MWPADGRQTEVGLVRACAVHGRRCERRITSSHLMQRVFVYVSQYTGKLTAMNTGVMVTIKQLEFIQAESMDRYETLNHMPADL